MSSSCNHGCGCSLSGGLPPTEKLKVAFSRRLFSCLPRRLHLLERNVWPLKASPPGRPRRSALHANPFVCVQTTSRRVGAPRSSSDPDRTEQLRLWRIFLSSVWCFNGMSVGSSPTGGGGSQALPESRSTWNLSDVHSGAKGSSTPVKNPGGIRQWGRTTRKMRKEPGTFTHPGAAGEPAVIPTLDQDSSN